MQIFERERARGRQGAKVTQRRVVVIINILHRFVEDDTLCRASRIGSELIKPVGFKLKERSEITLIELD